MKQNKILLFSKSNDVLVAELDADTPTSGLDLSLFNVKTVSMNAENGEYWYGDYTTGEVRAREDKPLIQESWLKYQTNVKILEKYPIHSQLNLIIDMIDSNLSNKTPEWTEFKLFLDRMKDEHKQQITVYSSQSDVYTFISEEEEITNAKKRSDLV